jgi:hypothetical protein
LGLGGGAWLTLQREAGPGSRVGQAAWSGPAGYVLLGAAERGASGVPVLELRPGQPAALLVVSLDVGPHATSETGIAFRVRPDGAAAVWSLDLPAREVLSWTQRRGALLLYLPREALPPGRYVLEATARREGTEELLLLARPFEVRPSS